MTLTRELMGGLTLAILWVNTLLIAAVALKQAFSHLKTRARCAPIPPGEGGIGLVSGRITEGAGPSGSLARYELDQLGRAGALEGGHRTIHFSDRASRGVVHGGAVETEGAKEALAVLPSAAPVWPAATDVERCFGCTDDLLFARVFEEARKAKGHARTVSVGLDVGAQVWALGEKRRGESGWVLTVPSDGFVSAIDPRSWFLSKALVSIAFALIETAIAAGITFLVLTPPVFDGWPSKIGGALGLGFFLAVQPLGTTVRDFLKEPSRAIVRGKWVEKKAP